MADGQVLRLVHTNVETHKAGQKKATSLHSHELFSPSSRRAGSAGRRAANGRARGGVWGPSTPARGGAHSPSRGDASDASDASNASNASEAIDHLRDSAAWHLTRPVLDGDASRDQAEVHGAHPRRHQAWPGLYVPIPHRRPGSAACGATSGLWGPGRSSAAAVLANGPTRILANGPTRILANGPTRILANGPTRSVAQLQAMPSTLRVAAHGPRHHCLVVQLPPVPQEGARLLLLMMAHVRGCSMSELQLGLEFE